MALPLPRDKFWVTDPPAVFDDTEENPDGVILICVFSSRKTLREFYASQTGGAEKKDMFQRRYQRLQRDCTMLQWNGLVIDPDSKTGQGRVIRFDGQADLEAFEGPEEVEPSLDELEADGESVGTLEEGVKAAPVKRKSSILTGLALK